MLELAPGISETSALLPSDSRVCASLRPRMTPSRFCAAQERA